MVKLKNLFFKAMIITSIATIIFGFYSQEKNHAKEINEIKKNQKQKIEKINKEYNNQIELMEDYILDREGRVQELTQELLTYDSLIRVNKKAKDI
jgi:hypothetical protein